MPTDDQQLSCQLSSQLLRSAPGIARDCPLAFFAFDIEDHGRVQTGTTRRYGSLPTGSHHTTASLLMPVRTTRKHHRGLRTTIKDTVNLRHGRRTNNYKDYKGDKYTVTFATGGGLTASKD